MRRRRLQPPAPSPPYPCRRPGRSLPYPRRQHGRSPPHTLTSAHALGPCGREGDQGGRRTPSRARAYHRARHCRRWRHPTPSSTNEPTRPPPTPQACSPPSWAARPLIPGPTKLEHARCRRCPPWPPRPTSDPLSGRANPQNRSTTSHRTSWPDLARRAQLDRHCTPPPLLTRPCSCRQLNSVYRRPNQSQPEVSLVTVVLLRPFPVTTAEPTG